MKRIVSLLALVLAVVFAASSPATAKDKKKKKRGHDSTAETDSQSLALTEGPESISAEGTSMESVEHKDDDEEDDHY